MYTVTFYSFKGGVGRSLALANVASELISRGKSVLMIDFDLEAPGLHTFNFGESNSEINGGVIDYVQEYLETNSSPDLKKHLIEYSLKEETYGKLWLMPAGKLDDSYSERLSKLDWNDLYNNRSGYIFFEDLKAQIEQQFKPDYVLIDSRTGHTDVAGICTRQLPNAVVSLFFPNEQNLTGLIKVSEAIDSHNSFYDDDMLKIQKHFVASNVPDLDDEYQILQDRLNKFSDCLGYKSLTSTIHRYNSLTLLDQQIFTVERKRTQLAKEYRKLTDEIALKNYRDSDGAIAFLNSAISASGKSSKSSTLNSGRLDKIQSFHENNAEIMNLFSHLMEKYGDYQEALTFINRTIELGCESSHLYIRKAQILDLIGDKEKALTSIFTAVSIGNLDYKDIRIAINLINRIDSSNLPRLISSESLVHLNEIEFFNIINRYLVSDIENIQLAIEAVKKYQSSNDNESLQQHLLHIQSLLFIANGDFDDALLAISETRPIDSNDISKVFNYAIAEWGKTKEVPVDLFYRVVELTLEHEIEMNSSNILQCISLANWLIGNIEEAKCLAERAASVLPQTAETFSCWSFLNATREEFLDDLEQMNLAFEKEGIYPKVIRN